MKAVYVGYTPAPVRGLPVKPWWDRWKNHTEQPRKGKSEEQWWGVGAGKGGFLWRGFRVLALRLNPGPPLSNSCL